MATVRVMQSELHVSDSCRLRPHFTRPFTQSLPKTPSSPGLFLFDDSRFMGVVSFIGVLARAAGVRGGRLGDNSLRGVMAAGIFFGVRDISGESRHQCEFYNRVL
jgi:hypothetical protein